MYHLTKDLVFMTFHVYAFCGSVKRNPANLPPESTQCGTDNQQEIDEMSKKMIAMGITPRNYTQYVCNGIVICGSGDRNVTKRRLWGVLPEQNNPRKFRHRLRLIECMDDRRIKALSFRPIQPERENQTFFVTQSVGAPPSQIEKSFLEPYSGYTGGPSDDSHIPQPDADIHLYEATHISSKSLSKHKQYELNKMPSGLRATMETVFNIFVKDSQDSAVAVTYEDSEDKNNIIHRVVWSKSPPPLQGENNDGPSN